MTPDLTSNVNTQTSPGSPSLGDVFHCNCTYCDDKSTRRQHAFPKPHLVVDKSLANLVAISDNLLINKPQLDAQNSRPSTRGAECEMRKTVQEWLDANQNGIGPAKKKSAARKPTTERGTKKKSDPIPPLKPRKKKSRHPK